MPKTDSVISTPPTNTSERYRQMKPSIMDQLTGDHPEDPAQREFRPRLSVGGLSSDRNTACRHGPAAWPWMSVGIHGTPVGSRNCFADTVQTRGGSEIWDLA